MEVVDEKSLAVDGKVHSDRPSTNSELAESIERRIDFDNGCGDVMVIVEDYSKDKPDLHGLLVSSNMMSRASDVWKRMFAGEWSETRTDRPVILDYREDGYVAVTIIMNIIHLRFGDVPTVVSLAELKEIAMFTDKWMVTALIVPWVQGWLEYLSGSVDNVGCEVEWLWIAWEFGLTDVFNRVGCRLAFGGAIPAAEPSQLIRFSFGVSDAQIGFPTSNVSEEEGTFYLDNSDTLPPEVEEVITEARKAMVDRMLTELYGYFDALLDWPTYLEEACDGIPAGSLLPVLKSLGLWPKPTLENISISPAQLRTAILGIRLSDCHNNAFGDSSRNFHPKYKLPALTSCGDFDQTLKSVRNVPLQHEQLANKTHLNHLKAQHAKVGIQCNFVPHATFKRWIPVA